MITNRSEFDEAQFPAFRQTARELELEEKLYETFLKMRDLLEQNSHSRYSNAPRGRDEAVVQGMDS